MNLWKTLWVEDYSAFFDCKEGLLGDCICCYYPSIDSSLVGTIPLHDPRKYTGNHNDAIDKSFKETEHGDSTEKSTTSSMGIQMKSGEPALL